MKDGKNYPAALDKQCPSDPLPMWLVKDVIDTLAPFMTIILSASLSSAEFPSPWKHAIVHPYLKYPGLDPTDVSNFPPVSNLSFLSKLLDRLVNRQLATYFIRSGLLPRHQSAYHVAYHQGHSGKTALLNIFNDLVDLMANGELSLLCVLNFLAAFDNVDHATLSRHLELTFGVTDQLWHGCRTT